jgi:hypothetical protein
MTVWRYFPAAKPNPSPTHFIALGMVALWWDYRRGNHL